MDLNEAVEQLLCQARSREWNRFRAEREHTDINLRPHAKLIKFAAQKGLIGSADLSRANFRGANLVGGNFSNCNLLHANFREANLCRCNFKFAKLRGTDFEGADLSGADFRNSYLIETVHRNTILHEVNFDYAYLDRVDFTRAELWSTSFIDVELKAAQFAHARIMRSIIASDFSGAQGLNEIQHDGPCVLDINSILGSHSEVPPRFLRGCGVSQPMIEFIRSQINTPIQFYSCFISYSHANKDFARRLHDALQGRGINCWLDEHQVLPGDDIHDVVNKAIRVWDKVLLCCSKESLTSWWVENELATAFRKEQDLMKQRGEKVLAIIPIDLDGFLFHGWQSPKRDTVLQRNAANFNGWESDNSLFEREFEKVVNALRADEGSRKRPPESKL